MPTNWSGDKYFQNLEKTMGDNLEKACIFFKGKVKEAINRSQPYNRSSGDNGIYYKGLEPSLPGEPPKKITGFLQRSIAHAMSPDRKAGFVGTNLDYGFYLELGTSKMAARPFLRSTLAENQSTIAKIISTGKA